MLKSLTPNLIADNVQETVDFYVNILGFTLVNSAPGENGLVWAQITLDNVSIMFQDRGSLEAGVSSLKGFPTGASGLMFVMMDNIQEFYTSIKDKVKIVRPMERAFYGHDEFSIFDVNGYLITFSEEVTAS